MKTENRRLGRWMLAAVILSAAHALAEDANLIRNPSFEQLDASGKPVDYALSGGAVYGKSLGNPATEAAGPGVALGNHATPSGGTVSQTVAIDSKMGRTFSFRFRGLPQDDFAAPDDGLYMQVEFSGNGGQTAYDNKIKQLYPLVQQARRDLTINGNGHVGGAAVWRDYTLNFYVPFPQVDRLKLTVGCKGSGIAAPSAGKNPPPGGGKGMVGGVPVKFINTSGGAFLVSDFRLTRLPDPAEPLSKKTLAPVRPAAAELLPLGGRWFYHARAGETHPPARFDCTNAGRLLYRDGPDDGYEAPFDGNMSATLRAGEMDSAGNIAKADQLIADNVTIRFEAGSLILHTRGLPNHPTGRFPEEGFGREFNPNYIQEQDETYYLPLDPKPDPGHIALTGNNARRALNMGPIGVAVNGVVFFNPYDAGMIDATHQMDRCCGHPNPDGQYHYHKYPICINSPWSDEGNAHSPLLGWAFDGFPIYGPYESANLMAKDVVGPTALNAFNIHFDAQRGWHYHVTPGRFPYLIGGYWGAVERRDIRPPRGRGPGPGPGGGRFPGPEDGPPPPW